MNATAYSRLSTRRLILPFLVVMALFATACSPATSNAATAAPSQELPESTPVKIRMDVYGHEVIATLENSAAGRDFAALLPLSLTLTDYAQIERISDLPKKLSIEGAPDGVAGRAGDLTYYAPWGNLAIFVGDGKHAHGLVRLGRVESGLQALQRPGPLNVRIERIEK
ncbi:hypothetical protein LVB87_12620 [Lysobacter sp. KIS68-7]|uniref:cyclophilin-like fold protein n=1 Tax=Lysobacter sp. KIS68-7 TaxID=2904252 RepID=UPI001E46B9FC|nr:cyclophilin-like fold protein [Lysobacter sp. KIS68-7]UHQ19018.1 hypothetical protein LVB87_12620 [Lysobacter sp. KIS68-7]